MTEILYVFLAFVFLSLVFVILLFSNKILNRIKKMIKRLRKTVKLSLVLMTSFLLFSCKPELKEEGIVSEVMEIPVDSYYRKRSIYRVTVRDISYDAHDGRVIFYTNTLYQVGDTIKIGKL